MKKSKGIVYISDTRMFLPVEKACIPVTDTGFQRGVGIFEVLITYKAKPMGLDEHLSRLQKSVKAIGFKPFYSSNHIKQKVLEGIKHFGEERMMIRIVITGGDSNNFMFKTDPRLVILFMPLKEYPSFYFDKGIKLLTSKLSRILPEIKSLNYLSGSMAYHAALNHRCHEGLYVDKNNNILEGTTFNFGIIKDKTVVVPEKNVLDGITIRFVIHLAKKLGLKVERRPIALVELQYVDEAFLTSSNREIMPIVKVDKTQIGDGKPGAYTMKLLEMYRDQAEAL